jgi:hypothetical protein
MTNCSIGSKPGIQANPAIADIPYWPVHFFVGIQTSVVLLYIGMPVLKFMLYVINHVLMKMSMSRFHPSIISCFPE